jgi:glutathione S-transferase
VWLALEHKQLSYELRMLSFAEGDTRKPEYLKLNPRHKVPVIVDDGFVLYESAAILEYLDERFPKGPLFPAEVGDRGVARRLIREVDSYLVSSHEKITRQLFFKPGPEAWDVQAIEDGREGYIAELAHFDAALRGDFVMGSNVGAVDYALYPFIATFVRLEMRKADLGLSASIPVKLAAWKKRMQALPYHEKTYPPHWRG